MLYDVAKPPVRLLLRTIWRPRLSGAENLPEQGPVILASNHLAIADTYFLPAQLPRRVHFLGKSDLFRSGSPLNSVLARIMRGLAVMPVDRSGGSASQSAIDAGMEVLDGGHVLGIYPEGTRSPDGRLHRGRTGVARLALASGAPIVPVAMFGTREAQGRRKLIPHRRPRIRAVLGTPVDAAAVAAAVPDEPDASVFRHLTDHVMERIAELSGQERVGEYASEVKARLRAEQTR